LAVAKAQVIKIGLDLHATDYVFARQIDHALIEPAQRLSREKFLAWVDKQKALAQRVVVCYEAGCFGYGLARSLQARGVECLVMVPENLDPRGERVQTDKLNAREITSRLDRYLHGNDRALALVKIPTEAQELQRSESRQRGQLLKSLKQLEAQGRSLLLEYGCRVKSGWWRERVWARSHAGWKPELVAMLGRWRPVILELEDQLSALSQRLVDAAPQHQPAALPALPLGVGALSWVVLCREVLEWGRFKNRRQVGCFGGLVPSEASTGQTPWRGTVTKVGNPRVRGWLVEMAWRLVLCQPGYHGLRGWESVLADRKAKLARKKAIVAIARRLFVDLWRLATGQTTPEQLGLTVKVQCAPAS
jgi:transposase